MGAQGERNREGRENVGDRGDVKIRKGKERSMGRIKEWIFGDL